MKNCVGNAEGISHGQRLVAAGCKVCGMGYEMVGFVLFFHFRATNNNTVMELENSRFGNARWTSGK